MTLKVDQLPRVLNSIWEAISKLQRDVRELRAARRLENATIGGGSGLMVQNGGTGPSVRITPNANGVGPLTSDQAAILISTGTSGEVTPALVSAYVATSGGVTTPSLVLQSPDLNTGNSYTWMQGGDTADGSPLWECQAGLSTISLTNWQLVMDVSAGASVTLDGSGLYFTGETWQSLTLNNGWTAFGSGYQAPIFMKKVDDMVQLAGLLAPGTTTGGTTVATLPAGYIPVADHVFRTSAGASATADVYVRSTGAVQIQNPSGTIQWLSLSGIRFPL